MTDETQTREQLQTEWAQFTPSAKTQCNQENDVGGIFSYVELQTCLEMERDVKGGRWEDVKVALPVVRGLHGSRTERTRASKAPLADSK